MSWASWCYNLANIFDTLLLLNQIFFLNSSIFILSCVSKSNVVGEMLFYLSLPSQTVVWHTWLIHCLFCSYAPPPADPPLLLYRMSTSVLKSNCNHSLSLCGINKWSNSLRFPCDSLTPTVRLSPPTAVLPWSLAMEEVAINFFLLHSSQTPSFPTPRQVHYPMNHTLGESNLTHECAVS